MRMIVNFLNKNKLFVLLLILLVMVGSFRFFFSIIEISGESMSPTLSTGNRIVVLKQKGPFPRGSIILVRPIKFRGRFFVKRLIGTHGDQLEFKEGYLYLNGRKTEEPYIREFIDDYSFPKVTVPEGHIYVLGDNRFYTTDSRNWGPVSNNEIQGRILFSF